MDEEIPELKIEIDVICATSRKLKAIWTMEAQQDLRQWHDLQSAQALTDMLAKEITAEIDAEIIKDLQNNAYGMPPIEQEYEDMFKEVEKNLAKGRKKTRPQYRSITDEWEVSKE
jgi:hypothetical protein